MKTVGIAVTFHWHKLFLIHLYWRSISQLTRFTCHYKSHEERNETNLIQNSGLEQPLNVQYAFIHNSIQ